MPKHKPTNSGNSSEKNTDGKTRRRWLNIGPGIIIAVIISILIGVNWYKTEVQPKVKHTGAPIVERQTISSSYEEKIGPTPEVGFILSRKDKIGLSNEQVSKLSEIERDWKEYYEPRIAEANEAARKANEYLADAQDNRRTPVAHITKKAGPLIALSREISDTRRAYWKQATDVLTEEQRDIVQKEREEDWAARMAKMSSQAAAKK